MWIGILGMFKFRFIINFDFSDDLGKDMEFVYGWFFDCDGIEDVVKYVLEVLE